MQIGDLVRFPPMAPQGQALGEYTGIVLRIDPTRRGPSPKGERIQVWWFHEEVSSWERRDWMETINENR